MKSIKVIKRKTAIIIIMVILILLMYTIWSYIEKFYQKEYEELPELSLYKDGKKLAQMIPLAYEWTYNGETKKYNADPEYDKQGVFLVYSQYEQFKKYDFPEENTLLLPSKENARYKKKMNERHKTLEYSYTFYQINNTKGFVSNNSYSGSGIGDASKSYLEGDSISIYSNFKVGEYLYVEGINFLQQGQVDYALKVVVFDEDQARIAKEYMNTPLEDATKIEELARKIKFNKLLNSVKLDGKNLTLEYQWHIEKEDLKMQNLVLFTCIPDLETITYSPKNKKTTLKNGDNGELQKGEIEQVVYTREEVDSESLANIENLKKFMKQI